MAKKTIVELTDDLDGSPADETLRFALDGSEFEIDLSKAHAKELRNALQPFAKAARSLNGKRGGRRRGGSGSSGSRASRDREQLQGIRDWAKREGYKVAQRGRISAEIERAYNEAH
jgi:Lsr2